MIFLTNLWVRAQKCEKMNPMQISDPKYFCKKLNKMSKKYKILRNFQIFLIFLTNLGVRAQKCEKNESNVDIWCKILLRNTILDFSNTPKHKFHKIYKKWKNFWKCQKKYKILRKFQIFLIFLTNLRVRAQKCEKMNPM